LREKSIGLVAPFRVQADALEKMVLADVPSSVLADLDLVIGEGQQAVGVECRVHPQGPASHLARRRTLVQATHQVAPVGVPAQPEEPRWNWAVTA